MFARQPEITFFTPEHFAEIASSVQEPPTSSRWRKARYENALHQLGRGNQDAAVEQWVKIVQKDPGCADAWFALAWFARGEQGLQEPYWHALALCAERIGEERHNLAAEFQYQADTLNLYWRPLWRISEPVVNADGLRGGYARILLDQGRYEEAEQWITRMTPSWGQTALRAELAVSEQEHLRAIKLLQKLGDERSALEALRVWGTDKPPTAFLLYLDAQLLTGNSLLRLNMYDAALTVYQRLLNLIEGRQLGLAYREMPLELRYEMAVALRALDREDEARAQFERIFAINADYRNVVEQLGLGERSAGEADSAFPASEDDDTAALFESFEEQFRDIDLPRLED
jgi:tetratricopeptide (TPR) repeat protein